MKPLFLSALTILLSTCIAQQVEASQAESKSLAAAIAVIRQTKEQTVIAQQKLRSYKLSNLLYDMLTTLPRELIEMIVSYDYLFEGKEILCRVNHEKQTATTMTFIPPHFIAIGDTAGRIKIWDSGTGNHFKTLQKERHPLRKIKGTLIKKLLSFHEELQSFNIWDIQSGTCDNSLVFSPTSSEEEKVSRLNCTAAFLFFLFPTLKEPLDEFRPTHCELQLEDKVNPPFYSDSDSITNFNFVVARLRYALVQQAHNNRIILCSCPVPTVYKLGELTGHTKPINALAQLPNGHLASGALDCTIRIWDLTKNTCVTVIPTMQPVRELAVTPNGLLIACFEHGSFQVFA